MNDFQPLAPDFARDPYPAYARLREQEGLTWYEPHQMFLVARYHEVNELVRNRSLVRTRSVFETPEKVASAQRRDIWHDMPYHSRFVQFSMLDSDGEVHDRLRAQVFRFFGPAPVAELRAALAPQIARWVEQAVERGRFDFIADLAAQVPGFTIGSLMGVPQEDCEQIRRWSADIVQYFDVDRTAEKKRLAENTTREFYRYLQELVDERRRNPQQDLLSSLIDVSARGLISHDELYSTCMLIVMAGHGSTLDVMGTGLLNLIRHPEQQRRWRGDPGLTKTAIQEMFRFDSPLPFFHRYAAEDIVLNNTPYPRGTRFGLLYGSANRDPAVFDEPDRFDIARFPNRHLAFGGGAHFCLGNHLARLSMDLLFNALLQRSRDIVLSGAEPEFNPGLSARGLKSLPVEVLPA